MNFPKSQIATLHRAAFLTRLRLEARLWRPAERRVRPDLDDVVVSGFLSEALGIGRAGRLTVCALKAAGFSVLEEDLRPLDRRLLTRPPVRLSTSGRTKIWIIHANPPEAEIAFFRHRYDSWSHLYRIGYWAWESSVAPARWAWAAQWFHEIWAPSDFVAEALKTAFDDAGAGEQTYKIRVMPHPVTAESPKSIIVGESVTAITLFDPRSDFHRKNPIGAIDAWLAAFPNPGPARLIVKTFEGARRHTDFETLNERIKHRPDITLVAQTLSDAETMALMSRCQILISLHRGEGFGLPLAEAMLMGLCVVATGWSGNLQFMNLENSQLIPYRLVPATPAYNGPRALWADPELAAAAAALRRLVEDRHLRMRLAAAAPASLKRLSQVWLNAHLTHRAL